ncbi:uncharacterized protein LOC105205590 [Solenopsis invicta]|uniref:uncharacterized protein LOC105205590 n=1 Tax=Solenopsis invicta TaxID=13686 RepID=UPI000595AC19|nr:uncharacterized protein LOC105205590 [Solenopsis invicta]
MFDPLGWLAPAVVRAKIHIQTTWLQGLGWDDPLADADATAWRAFQSELHLLQRIRVPRWLRCSFDHVQLELHGFADASERAYAAVAYLCVRSAEESSSSIIMAKTRVAPLKQVSLPRLELAGAALLARLVSHVQSALSLQSVPVFLWSDSTVALRSWIQGHPSRWTTYVANRVAEIQRTIPGAHWRHVPGCDNPADCASRGVRPGELVAHPLWWSGPGWLTKEMTEWPPSAFPADRELPEVRIRSHHMEVDPEEPAWMTRFSGLNRLIRVAAWCRRWLGGVRPAVEGGEASLNVDELEAARLSLIRLTQSVWWERRLVAVERDQALPRGSSLVKLSPFLDERGILRVGGRLRHSLLSYDEKHPVILPRRAHLTRLVIEDCHRAALHGGTQATLGLIQQRYWIPGGRAAVKAVIHRCLPCV